MAPVRLATPSDVPVLARALARAFATDPVWEWIVRDRRRWDRRAGALFAHEVSAKIGHGQVTTTDDRAGAALWGPPGLARRGLAALLGHVAAAPSAGALVGVRGLRRGLAVMGAMEAARPPGDHWYLAILGVDPDHQGRGVGSALLGPVLDRCDRDGQGAYLESSNPANVPFYERHGFRVTGRVGPDGCPPLDQMWRDPRPPDPDGGR